MNQLHAGSFLLIKVETQQILNFSHLMLDFSFQRNAIFNLLTKLFQNCIIHSKGNGFVTVQSMA